MGGAWPDISWYGVDDNAVTYRLLLTILIDNGLSNARRVAGIARSLDQSEPRRPGLQQ
jgi:hypothetical protein